MTLAPIVQKILSHFRAEYDRDEQRGGHEMGKQDTLRVKSEIYLFGVHQFKWWVDEMVL